MPLIYFFRKYDDRWEYYFAQMLEAKSSSKIIKSAKNDFQIKNSWLSDFKSNYKKLSDLSKECLDYCSIITFKYRVYKDKLVRLLSAASILQEKLGEIMEDVIEKTIEELISFKMLQEGVYDKTEVKVSKLYNSLFLVEVDEQDFVTKAANLPVYAVIGDDGKNIPPDFKKLQIHSLFLITAERRGSSFSSDPGLSNAYMQNLCELKSLLVLDLDGKIECLPDQVGDLVHLKYLGLFCSDIVDLPKSVSNLQKLQTLDIRASRIRRELPLEVLSIQQLRHFLMSHSTNNCETRVPKGFGTMVNLRTCDGVYGGDGTAKELSALTQLKTLAVMRVSEDHAGDLLAAITKMRGLVSLSLEAEGTIFDDTNLLPDVEQFFPPPLLQELSLNGRLVEIPKWLASIENLTKLGLHESKLSENPNEVLQFLPKLKHLSLQRAYEVKYIGKEFCEAGGFPKLETLRITSGSLVEWSEIVNGAFPSLRRLTLWNCNKLRFLPEGLQNISTLQELILFNIQGDLQRQLKDEQNYKIQNIPYVWLQ